MCRVLHSGSECTSSALKYEMSWPEQTLSLSLQQNTHTLSGLSRGCYSLKDQKGGGGGNFQIIWHIVERFRAYTCKRLLEVATYHFHLFGRVSLGILKE